MCFLLKVCDELEVCKVFGLVRRGCKSDINMFARDPLVEVIFNLKAMFVTLEPIERISDAETQ